MEQKKIRNARFQTGATIATLLPSQTVQARIYSEEQRDSIDRLIRHHFLPHHSSVGRGRTGRKHWRLEKYRGKFGKGFRMITTSPFSRNFNHITYFLAA